MHYSEYEGLSARTSSHVTIDVTSIFSQLLDSSPLPPPPSLDSSFCLHKLPTGLNERTADLGHVTPPILVLARETSQVGFCLSCILFVADLPNIDQIPGKNAHFFSLNSCVANLC